MSFFFPVLIRYTPTAPRVPVTQGDGRGGSEQKKGEDYSSPNLNIAAKNSNAMSSMRRSSSSSAFRIWLT